MKKRINVIAQVSVFIILAIVLIAAGGIAFYIAKYNSGADNYFSQPDVKIKTDNIKSSIQSCMGFSADTALYIIGIQGGYYEQPKQAVDFGWTFIPYYFYEGEILIPSKEEIETEISAYYDKALQNCIDKIDTQGFLLKYKTTKTKTSIYPGEVNFVADMPVSITDGRKSVKFELKEMPIIKKVKLYEIYEIAKFITDSHNSNPDELCLSCVSDMSEERDLLVDFINFDENKKLIMISENANMTRAYSFEFLEKYKGGALEIKEPVINEKKT